MLGATVIWMVINALTSGRQEQGPGDNVTGILFLVGLVITGPSA